MTSSPLLERIRSHPQIAKFWQWGKLISITGLSQIAIQGIGFACGILVIRLLTTQQYALYTMANTMLATMTSLADVGVSTGVMSQGGKVWQNKVRLGMVLVTGMTLRRKFAFYSLAVATPVLLYLFRRNDVSWGMSLALILSLLPAFFMTLSGSLLEIVPKLHQDIVPLQKTKVWTNVLRLALTGAALAAFPFAVTAILAAGLGQIYLNRSLRRIALPRYDATQPEDPEVREEILKIVRRIFPTAIYYSIASQMSLWLISIFGETTSIAHLGALDRLGMISTLFTTVFGTIMIPRFARLPLQKDLIKQHFFRNLFLLVGIASIMITTFTLFQDKLLFILGSSYSGLSTEIILSSIANSLLIIHGGVQSLVMSRGWIYPPWISLTYSIGTLVACVMIFRPHDVTSALHYSIAMVIPGFIAQLILFGYNLRKMPR